METDEEILAYLHELELNAAAVTPNEQIVPSGERRCPICQETMRCVSEQGVMIERCDDHGVWLDTGELQSIIGQIKRRHRLSSKIAIRNARDSGKKSALLWGAWSLLFD